MNRIKIAFLALLAALPISAHAETVAQCMQLGLPAAVADAVCGEVSMTSFSTTAGDVRITGGDLSILTTGKTIELETGTAASACAGSATATGTTAVTVSTTCATTGSKIFLTRSSAPSGTAICWQTNIVNGVSFDLDCSGAETGTFDWLILHEAP